MPVTHISEIRELFFLSPSLFFKSISLWTNYIYANLLLLKRETN